MVRRAKLDSTPTTSPPVHPRRQDGGSPFGRAALLRGRRAQQANFQGPLEGGDMIML